MIGPKKTIPELVDDLISSREPGDKFQIALQLSRMEPEDWKHLQALNRAIYDFRDKYPKVYDRAKNPNLRFDRSIPPAPPGGSPEYFRLEEACAALVQARAKWKDALKQKKTGISIARRHFEGSEFKRALSEMKAIGRKRNKPSQPEKPAQGRKPKRRLHS